MTYSLRWFHATTRRRPLMASLQARHQRDCAIVVAAAEKQAEPDDTNKRRSQRLAAAQWTTFQRADKDPKRQAERPLCDCEPMFHLVFRHDGKLVREPVGHNRKDAERALDSVKGDIANHRLRVPKQIAFNEWADKWLESLTAKPATKRVYGYSIAAARRTFGSTKLRELDTSHIDRFLATIRRDYAKRYVARPDKPARVVSDSTLSKHLRQLSSCLEAAVAAGYLDVNPVRRMHRSSKPRPVKKKPSYFTDSELARLWPELADRPLMIALAKVAVGTGARLGELSARTWDDVSLQDRELHITSTYGEFGYGTPKSNEVRVVDLTEPAAQVLEDWLTLTGDEGLIFELEAGGHVLPRHADAALYAAMARAGIPRIGERGGKRTWHSLRNTFARIALEGGAPIDWVSKQLGHSSIHLTVSVYGEWSRTAQKAEAKRVSKAFRL
jgi:integrase